MRLDRENAAIAGAVGPASPHRRCGPSCRTSLTQRTWSGVTSWRGASVPGFSSRGSTRSATAFSAPTTHTTATSAPTASAMA
jgi:hypothetical protein